MERRTIRRRVASWFTRSQSRPLTQIETGLVAQPKTAFLLLGGGARGSAQAGALSVLLEEGIVPDLVVGISAGAWNGAFLALDPTPQRALKLEGLWTSTTSTDVIGQRRWSSALNALTNRAALYDSAGMRKLAERHLLNRRFDETRIPLRIVATNLISGQARIFSEGPLLSAVLASSAIPGIFPPVAGEGEMLADGGLVEWAGCMYALDAGVTRVFLVACGAVSARAPQLDSFRLVLQRSMEVSGRSSFAKTTFALRGAGVEVIPIFPELTGGHALDFDRAPELIQAGRAAAKQALRSWEESQPATTLAQLSVSAS